MTLGAFMLVNSALPAQAASGRIYSYANLELSWSTTSSAASATLRSGNSARLAVQIEGKAYSGSTKKGNFSASKVNQYGASVSCRATRKGTTIKNGFADGNRNFNAQTIYAPIYY